MLSIETHFFPLPSTLEIILSASCACQLESVANLLFVSADLNTVVTQSPESEGLVVGSVDWGLYLIFFFSSQFRYNAGETFSDCSCFSVLEILYFSSCRDPAPALLLLPDVITFQAVLHSKPAVALWEGLCS